VYHQKGEAIPEGWAYDAEGRPTTDAACRVEADMSTIKVGALYQNFSLAVFRRARHAHFAFETQVKFLGERALPTMLWLRLRVHIKRYATGGKRTRRSTSLGTSQCQTVM
jgi:hypothetical protein